MEWVRVAVDANIPHVLSYIVPCGMEVKRGDVVEVPLKGMKRRGVVLGPGEEVEGGKEIMGVVASLPENLVRLGEWMIEYYGCPPGLAFSQMLPPGKRKEWGGPEGKIEGRKIQLNEEQKRAYEEIVAHDGFGVFLLYGVTGSGKTEVYLHVARKVLESGRGVIFLVPEISLIPQLKERIEKSLGPCEEYHSKLSKKERNVAWWRTREGKVRVVVGARMAVFAPMEDVGLIVVDEEHDPSYKQEDPAPRYSGRDVAVMRGKIEGARVILGTATPSLESYYNVAVKKYKMLRLTRRISGKMPEVEVVDMRGKKGVFSGKLLKELERSIKEGGQAILFLNRRGFSPFIQCEDCGMVVMCPRCNVTLTYHKRLLMCHHCGYTMPPPEFCPSCGGMMRWVGYGTQRVEEELREHFGDVVIKRVDADTMKRKGDLEALYRGLKEKEIRVVVGTSMITMGLDIPGVNMVGVLNADQLLNFPDFRAAERAYQVLSQVAGRAGRGEVRGKVIIQTRMPDSHVIRAVKERKYATFYKQELEIRKSLGYPPFTRFVRIVVKGRKKEKAEEVSERIREKISGGEIRGPFPCPISKLNNWYRFQILIKLKRGEKISFPPLQSSRDLKIVVDVDPVDML